MQSAELRGAVAYPTQDQVDALCDLKAFAKRFLGRIARFHNPFCYASNHYWFAQLGLSASAGKMALKRALDALKARGWLWVGSCAEFRRWFGWARAAFGLALPPDFVFRRRVIVFLPGLPAAAAASLAAAEPRQDLPLFPEPAPEVPDSLPTKVTNCDPHPIREFEFLSEALPSVPSGPAPGPAGRTDGPAIASGAGTPPGGPGPDPETEPGSPERAAEVDARIARGECLPRMRQLAIDAPKQATVDAARPPARPDRARSLGIPRPGFLRRPAAPARPPSPADLAIAGASRAIAAAGPDRRPDDLRRLAAELAVALGQPPGNLPLTADYLAETFTLAIDGALDRGELVMVLTGLVGSTATEPYKVLSARVRDLRKRNGLDRFRLRRA